MFNKQKKERERSKTPLFAAALLIAIATTAVTTTTVAYASTIDVPDPVLELEEPPVNATEDRQMIIRPGEVISPNGTRTLDMAGADDVDFKGLVPEGVTVIVTNTSATVTNQPVEQPGIVSTAPTPTPIDESSDNGGEDEE